MKFSSSKFFDEKLLLGARENFSDGDNLIFRVKIGILGEII